MINMLDGVKAIIFDLDGTLVDSMWMWKAIDVEYLGQFGLEVPVDLQRKIEGMDFTETAVYFKETFGITHSIAQIQKTWLAMAKEKYRREIPLKKGALQLIAYAKKQGIKLAIASSNAKDLIEEVLKAYEILDDFQVICTCQEVKNSKPAPDVYLLAAQRLQIKPADCLVFEDIVTGIRAGKGAGMLTCAVEDAYSHDTLDRKKELADYYVEDFTEVLPVYDFVYVLGDVYVDHPSFGCAIITQVLRTRGYSVAIIEQPDWKDPDSITCYGEPRLGFLVSAGNMDSMVNHYTVAKKHRRTDAYSPNGEMGHRPDRAVIVYSNLIRRTYKHTPIILGGIEASLRRMAHYDYWSDSVKRSVLLDSGADLISYGMGERTIVQIAEALESGIPVESLTFLAGTVYRCKKQENLPADAILLPSYEKILQDKKAFAESFAIQHRNMDHITAKPLAEDYGKYGYIVANPPAAPLTMQEMDDVYDLPYSREYPDIPAVEEIRFSLTSNRGCFGSCNFCALTFHQGRVVQVRSHDSIIEEAKKCIQDPAFKGYIHDVGGPTADFRQPSCAKQLEKGTCPDRRCLFPKPCGNLNADHSDYIALLRKLRSLPKVKKVFIRSGIRFDYVLADKKTDFLKELAKYHVSGQLRVAPEHVSAPVLACMGKPTHEVYTNFLKQFKQASEQAGLKQYAVPYFMSSHPGCTLKDAVKLAEYIRDLGFMPEQVQDFYPTPGTMSTCMYYTGLDPETLKPVYIPKNPHEKAMQRALIQYKNPDNYQLVREALIKAGREDLIGFDGRCLIRPEYRQSRSTHSKNSAHKEKNNANIPYKDKSQKGEKRSTKRKTIRNVHKKH